MNIDNNIPIPTADSRGPRSPIPLPLMEIAQSVFVPESIKAPPSVRAYANQTGDRLNRRFTTRKVTENGNAGVRVWRIA